MRKARWNRCFKRGERGFTLVELLIVIAILGVLAAVVVPSVIGMFGRGGAQAWTTDSKTMRSSAAGFYADVHQDPDNAPPVLTSPATVVLADALGHWWPSYSGEANDSTAVGFVPLVDGVTTYAALDTPGERATTAIIALGLLSQQTDSTAGAYLDIPESAHPWNGDATGSYRIADALNPQVGTLALSALTPPVSLGGTHIWYVDVGGRISSAYFTGTTGTDVIHLETKQSQFNKKWP